MKLVFVGSQVLCSTLLDKNESTKFPWQRLIRKACIPSGQSCAVSIYTPFWQVATGFCGTETNILHLFLFVSFAILTPHRHSAFGAAFFFYYPRAIGIPKF